MPEFRRPYVVKSARSGEVEDFRSFAVATMTGGQGKTTAARILAHLWAVEGPGLRAVAIDSVDQARTSRLAKVVEGVEELRIDASDEALKMGSADVMAHWDRFGELLAEGGVVFDFGANAIQRVMSWARAVRPRDYLGEGPELVVIVPVTAQVQSAEDGLWTLKGLLEVEPLLVRMRPVVMWNDAVGYVSKASSTQLADLQAFIAEKGIATFTVEKGALGVSEHLGFTELRTRSSADHAKVTGQSIARAHSGLHLFKVWLDASVDAARAVGLGPKKPAAVEAPEAVA